MKTTLLLQIADHSLSSVRPEDLTNIEAMLPHISFNKFDMSEYGYATVGTVEVDVELIPRDEIIGNAVIALRAKAAGIRAEATAKSTVLEGAAQQLLAITNEVVL